MKNMLPKKFKNLEKLEQEWYELNVQDIAKGMCSITYKNIEY